MTGLHITAARPASWLLDMDWHTPLAEWPREVVSSLPRGLSRHVVRYAEVAGNVLAVKEIEESLASHEYQILHRLQRTDLPTVEPIAVISGRQTLDGEPLPAALVTRHLHFSLPYRSLLQQRMSPTRLRRVLDSLAVLLVRLHLAGVYWGDVSLSNTLFRRDAGEYAAYFVDAETARIYPELSDGQRDYDVDLARVNIIGELMDLQSGGVLPDDYDVVDIGEHTVHRYQELWNDLTAKQVIDVSNRWELDQRIRRLNELGFDVGEMAIDTQEGVLTVQPRIVDAGHYRRQIHDLTGLSVEEKQAQRLLNDIETYRATTGPMLPLSTVAARWLAEVFAPTIAAIPPHMRAKLEPAQVFHEILEHRWYLSEKAGKDVSTEDAVADYIASQLAERADEERVLNYPDPV
ncbi:DUF4032 domain-containing protein [Nanchangia anserum]|uniref:DUF4032 domain-containing protein n=1 Tax=Nanchangia anserum TaxID=2692125 RepID=A0A8I0G798_9ACTO|nr:DUF4032 domain-containing protein [Nanchangia anserum]MBD3689160.1 DUF4032 domain-containing protein [Nanchangia anserum]QOX81392.1 DUF4032 domain-containing protein [Nanchangia anserum]